MDKSQSLKSVNVLSLDLTQKVTQYARENHVTVSTVLNAAWAFLLFIYSRENKVVFGSTISGRTEEFEPTVGLLINTIPSVVTFKQEMKVTDWLRQIQINLAGARDHAQTSLSHITACSSLPKGSSLFDSLLIYENYPTPSTERGSTNPLNVAISSTLEKETLFEKTSLPLTIFAEVEKIKTNPSEVEDHLKLMMVSMVHTDDSLEHLQRELQTVIEQMVIGDNTKTVGQLLLIDDISEFHEINDTKVEFDDEICITEIISKMMTNKPDTVAVSCGDEQITYGELDRRIGMLMKQVCFPTKSSFFIFWQNLTVV